ncbi:hypothetical protein FB45DRAFT_867418 [Roridomyces roridus]|uniref:Uncharacterized protein n=1 Tax=Roridomyces roridus TaxID=1738132 RepID=A0AAD7BQZ9_9AGAR|nr:hypothetical protein FB45DRAFT_867418 [Roridomyces roridus]
MPMVKTRHAPAGDPSYGGGAASGHKAKGSDKPRAAPSTASAVGPSTTPLPGPSTTMPGPPLSLPPQPAFAFHYPYQAPAPYQYPYSHYPAQYTPYPPPNSLQTNYITHPHPPNTKLLL